MAEGCFMNTIASLEPCSESECLVVSILGGWMCLHEPMVSSLGREAVGLCQFEVNLVYIERSEPARDPVFALKQYRLLRHPIL